MLELAPGTEQRSTLSSSLAPSRLRFAWTIAAAMCIGGDTPCTNQREELSIPEALTAPDLANIPKNAHLLGRRFRIGEHGPDACLEIENQKLVLHLNGEKFVVQKICTDEGISLNLTPMCIASCRAIASLHADGNGVIGRVSIPFMHAMEHRMASHVMLQLAEQLRKEKKICAEGGCICLEWKNAEGKVLGSATLKPSPRSTSLASR